MALPYEINVLGHQQSTYHPREREYQAEYRAYCFGQFQLYHNSKLIRETIWRRNKAKSLLKWFLLNPDKLTAADQFIDLFWPSAPAETALNNLHVTIHYLRHLLEPDLSSRQESKFIERKPNNFYIFNMNKTWWTDVKEVSDLYNAACDLDQANKLTKAIFYYRKVVNFCNSGFLPENHYETWMYPYKQRYDRIYSRCLIRLIHIHQQFEDFDDILEYAYQAISLDPCNELANLALIDVYYRQGNKPAAIQKIDDFQSMLSRDLDIQSYNKLQGLREKICMC